MKEVLILSESTYDFKYNNIYSGIENITVVEGKFLFLVKLLLKNKCIYHIRYVKYRGLIGTVLRLIIIFLVSRLSGSKILWSCHNIYEHNIPSKKYNNLVRVLLCKLSDGIIVFHKDLIKYLPKFATSKTSVASFGDFSEFISQQTQENESFSDKYSKWLANTGIRNPDLVSISTAKRNNLSFLIEQSEKDKLNSLIIAPNVKLQRDVKDKSILFYNDDFVKKEIKDILTINRNLVGFIGHDNISVPTSLYMYASFGIPVIVLDNEPSNSIVHEAGIGKVYDGSSSLKQLVEELIADYDEYSKKCLCFINENSWTKSSLVHQQLIEKLSLK